MNNWKYTDATKTVVYRVNEDGSCESCLFSALPEGTVVGATDPVVTPPISVSPRQIRQALTALGLRGSIESEIAAADQDTKDWYEFATAFEENHPAVIALAAALDISQEQVHALFSLASGL